MEVTPSSLTHEFISNKHALDTVFGKQFNYKVASTSQTTTLIGALKMLRSKPFGFNFIDAFGSNLKSTDFGSLDQMLLFQIPNMEIQGLPRPFHQRFQLYNAYPGLFRVFPTLGI